MADLEAAGIGIIQIDEPALREGLPLKRSDWDAYLQWGVEAFRLNAAVAKDDTQIHTHMCYCEFNDIMDSIAALDADVITVETSRSDMELLESFEAFEYPNEIGPGVYDIHSPNVPSVEWIEALLKKAAQRIPVERLWVNPDCGLKTRGWPETRAALANMVQARREICASPPNRYAKNQKEAFASFFSCLGRLPFFTAILSKPGRASVASRLWLTLHDSWRDSRR